VNNLLADTRPFDWTMSTGKPNLGMGPDGAGVRDGYQPVSIIESGKTSLTYANQNKGAMVVTIEDGVQANTDARRVGTKAASVECARVASLLKDARKHKLQSGPLGRYCPLIDQLSYEHDNISEILAHHKAMEVEASAGIYKACDFTVIDAWRNTRISLRGFKASIQSTAEQVWRLSKKPYVILFAEQYGPGSDRDPWMYLPEAEALDLIGFFNDREKFPHLWTLGRIGGYHERNGAMIRHTLTANPADAAINKALGAVKGKQ
jgi:hypothetical protein